MRKLLVMLAVLVSAAAVTVAPAGAITGNWAKDFVHDYVVLIAFYDADGEFVWRCSGSLLNSTTVLTAGHCTDVAEVPFRRSSGHPRRVVPPTTLRPTPRRLRATRTGASTRPSTRARSHTR